MNDSDPESAFTNFLNTITRKEDSVTHSHILTILTRLILGKAACWLRRGRVQKQAQGGKRWAGQKT